MSGEFNSKKNPHKLVGLFLVDERRKTDKFKGALEPTNKQLGFID